MLNDNNFQKKWMFNDKNFQILGCLMIRIFKVYDV